MVSARRLAEFRKRNPAYGTNQGHGHVWERPDGWKARCSGLLACYECLVDYASIKAPVGSKPD